MMESTYFILRICAEKIALISSKALCMLVLACLLLVSCGQKGPLRLEPRQGETYLLTPDPTGDSAAKDSQKQPGNQPANQEAEQPANRTTSTP